MIGALIETLKRLMQIRGFYTGKPLNFLINKSLCWAPCVSTKVKTAVHELGAEDKRQSWREK
jgi:hypothetical protein